MGWEKERGAVKEEGEMRPMTLSHRQVDTLFVNSACTLSDWSKRNPEVTELLEPQVSRAELVCS